MDIALLKNKLSEIFAVSSHSISEPSILGDGISNTSYLFRIGAAAYVARVPVDSLPERDRLAEEKKIYLELASHGVRGIDELVYFNIDEGLKVTRYIEGARYPDITDSGDIGRCASLLKGIHDSGVSVDARFDLMELFLSDEARVGEAIDISAHMSGYEVLRNKAIAIYNGHEDIFPVRFNHIDPIRYNFLFTSKRDYLIDFEYSCMASPMIDLAAFIVYHKLSGELIDGLMRSYLGRATSEAERSSLYRYLALESLYSALWYLERIGGEESIKMRRYMDECYAAAGIYAEGAGHAN